MSRFSHSSASSAATALPAPRKLIRSKATKLFLTNEGLWTHNLQDAAGFDNRDQAQSLAHKFHIHDSELYYLFGDTADLLYDFTIPLN